MLVFALIALQQAAVAPAQPQWNISWDEQSCSMTRQPEKSGDPMIALMTVPGTNVWDVIIGPDVPGSAGTNVSIRLQPGDETLTLNAAPTGSNAGRIFVAVGVDDSAVARFAGRERVELLQEGLVVASISLPAIDRALAGIRECIVSRMRQWGVDPDVDASLRTRPQLDREFRLAPSDFPRPDLRLRGLSNMVTRITVGVDGRATDCTVVSSSGHEVIDRTFCDAVRRRFQGLPATNAEGITVAAPIIAAIHWSLRR